MRRIPRQLGCAVVYSSLSHVLAHPHSTGHTSSPARRILFLFGNIRYGRLCHEQNRSGRCRVLNTTSRHLYRIDDARLNISTIWTSSVWAEASKPDALPFATTSRNRTCPSSRPQFFAICRNGDERAEIKIRYPTVYSSCAALSTFFISLSPTFAKAAPPPGTIPSEIAAFVALTASSILSFRYFISVSVAAPTRMTATPPESFATRSSSFSLSNLESVFSTCVRSWPTRF